MTSPPLTLPLYIHPLSTSPFCTPSLTHLYPLPTSPNMTTPPPILPFPQQLNCHLASHRSHDHPPIWLALFWHSLSTFIYSFLQSFCTSSLLPLSPHLSQDHPQVTRSPLQMTSLSLTLLLYIPCRLMLAALRSRSRSSCMLRSRRTTRRNCRLPNRSCKSVPTCTSLDQHHREPRTQRSPLKVVLWTLIL